MVEVYQLQVRVYEMQERDRVYAEVYAGEADDGKVLASAHLDFSPAWRSNGSRHEQIMEYFVMVCEELSENWGEPLF
jgi:hypothetical protein